MAMNKPVISGKALVFMTAHDCEMYVSQSLISLSWQTHDDFHVLFVDDCSHDDTGKIAERLLADLFPGRHTFIRNSARLGKSRNAWEHLRSRTKEAEFVAVVDGDDQLVDVRILERIAASYRNNVDVVWTNYITDKGLVGANAALDPGVSPRHQGWKTSHFFTFRASLLDNVPESYFKLSSGEWFGAACDIALALPLLDQTRRYEFIPVNAYRYISTNPYSHHNLDPESRGLNSSRQQQSARDAFQRTPLPRIDIPPAEPKSSDVDRQLGRMESAAEQAWNRMSSERLAATFPKLLDACAIAGRVSLTPMQLLAFEGIVRTSPSPQVLFVGPTNGALFLATLLEEIGGKLTCLCLTSAHAGEMRARLVMCGLEKVVEVFVTDSVSVSLADLAGTFVDTSVLGEGNVFNVVVVDLRQGYLPADSAVVSLPALANHLTSEGFRFCLLADDTPIQQAVEHWAKLSAGLHFCLDAIGGSGLLVTTDG